MWWSKPIFRAFCLLALVAAGTSGCGFRPMYGAKGGSAGTTVDTELAQVQIGPIKDRIGQQLRNALVQRFTPKGEAADTTYSMTVKLGETFNSLGYRKDTYATVGNLVMSAQVTLSNEKATLMSGSVTANVYFDYLGPRYASVAAERDAEEQAITQLADEIRNRASVAIQRYKANPNDEIFRRRAPFQDESVQGRPSAGDGVIKDRP